MPPHSWPHIFTTWGQVPVLGVFWGHIYTDNLPENSLEMWCEIPDQVYLPHAVSHLREVLLLENWLYWINERVNGRLAQFFNCSLFIRKRVFQERAFTFFFSYKECFVFFFNENEWQVPSDGLFPCLFKSLVAKTLSVIHHRSYHKEECQNRTHSSQPLC